MAYYAREIVVGIHQREYEPLWLPSLSLIVFVGFYMAPIVRQYCLEKQFGGLTLLLVLSGATFTGSYRHQNWVRSDWSYWKGFESFNDKNYEKAIYYFERARVRHEQDADTSERLAYAYLIRGFAYKNAHDWPHALEAAKKSIDVKPDYAPAYELAGFAEWHIEGPNSSEARNYYRHFSQLEPDPKKKDFLKQLYPDWT